MTRKSHRRLRVSRIILAQDAEMWLISINGQHIDEFITLQRQVETNMQEIVNCRGSGYESEKLEGQHSIEARIRKFTRNFPEHGGKSGGSDQRHAASDNGYE